MAKHRPSIIALMARAALGVSLFAWLIGTAMPARGSPTEGLSLDTHILNPPNAITDLSASPVGVQNGDVQLVWTAPANLNRVGMDHYLVRYATYPAPGVPQADAWWSSFAATEKIVSPAQAAGVVEFTSVTGLTLNVTYYFGIKAVDRDGEVSPIDTRTGTPSQANSLPLNLGGSPPASPTNFAGFALSTGSIQWTWDLMATATYYALSISPSDVLITHVNGNSYTEFGFTPNAPLTRIVRSGNAYGQSPPTAAVTRYTLAEIPANLAASNIGLSDVTLSWTSNGNPGGTQYRLERSNNGVVYAPVATQGSTVYQDTGLVQLTTYYYRVRAVNGDGLFSSPTSTVTVFTSTQGDTLAPAAPAGLKGFLDPTGSAFTLTWEPVHYNVDGSSITDLAGYYVYRRNSLTGAGTRLTPVPLTVTAFADAVNSGLYYYTIRAVDTAANESADSLIADSSPDANIIYLSTDGVSHVLMPDSVNDLLRSAYNKYGVPLTIRLEEEPLPNDGSIVRNIRLKLIRTDNGEILTDLAFAKPQALVAVGYNVVNGQITAGPPGTGGAPQINAASPDQLSLYWFNGVTWVRIGGTLDRPGQTINTKSSFLGNYQLRIAANPSTLSLPAGNVYPRLFTPNGDGLNDRVYFVLENPNNVGVGGEIFDKEGRHVRNLPSATNGGIGTTLIWDGKDDRGNVVPGGAYIYKISGEGHSFTGTVGVAR